MVFSSLVFLTIALPAALAFYYLLPRGLRNGWLLAFSLFFYAWGEPVYLLLMLANITLNYLAGRCIGAAKSRGTRRLALLFAVLANLGLLFYFKYASTLTGALNAVFGTRVRVPGMALPIGISFYTFQALSYDVDVYRGQVPVQKNWAKLALYISFFPQLIAGPILRYSAVAAQIERRTETLEGFCCGLSRFAIGLGKKVLIANAVARVADEAFAGASLAAGWAWLGALAYALQIYFDFSGYSDMAIGLGAMFGFTYPENFNAPYTAVTMRDFWRRWHISLSSWFRDYLYIPLGGSRRGRARHIANLLFVFLLTGIWHGAGANFLVWGLYCGALCSGEVLLGEYLCGTRLGRLLRRALTLALVLWGWVIFRAETLAGALDYLKMMFAGTGGALRSMTPRAALALGLGCLGSTALPGRVISALGRRARETLFAALAPLLILLCLLALASGAYNPFIYFRF